MKYYKISEKHLKEFKVLCDEKGIKYETEAERLAFTAGIKTKLQLRNGDLEFAVSKSRQ